jgi:hypothetical protein
METGDFNYQIIATMSNRIVAVRKDAMLTPPYTSLSRQLSMPNTKYINVSDNLNRADNKGIMGE